MVLSIHEKEPGSYLKDVNNLDKQQQTETNSNKRQIIPTRKNRAFSCCTFVEGKGGISQSVEPDPDKSFVCVLINNIIIGMLYLYL